MSTIKPDEFLQEHMCMDYKKSQFWKKKIKMLYRFKMAAK